MGNKGKEERNLLLEGILNLEMLCMPYERFTYNDLLRELEVDYFAGYEELLPVMLMTTQDPVMERTGRRMFLQLYRERMEQDGARTVVEERYLFCGKSGEAGRSGCSVCRRCGKRKDCWP